MNWVRRCVGSAGSVALLAAQAGVLALTGCGMPGAPLPPTLNLPVPVKDLAATRAGDEVSLTWTMPKKNTDKLLLKGNLHVVVCRREGGAGPCAPVADLQLSAGADGTFSETLPRALASGVPAIVTPDGGPCTIVRDGETGRIASDDQFAAAVGSVLANPAKHEEMRKAARAYALTASWDSVFEGVYEAYETVLPQTAPVPPASIPPPSIAD